MLPAKATTRTGHRTAERSPSLCGAPAAGRRLLPADLSREEAVRRLETFYRLTRLVAESNNDADRLVHDAARLISEVLGDLTAISLLNVHGETYHVAAYHDPDPAVQALFEQTLRDVTSIPRDQGWVAKVISTGQPLLIPSISNEEATAGTAPAFMEFVRRVGAASVLVVPISGQSGVLGAVSASRHTGGRPYTEADQYFLMEIAFRLGLAIEGAMLVASLRNEVSARLFAREALAASEERFLSIFRSAALGIKIVDLVGTILETNSAFQAMTGYDEAQLIAMHFYDIIHPQDVARVLRSFNELKMHRIPQIAVEHRLIRRDGSIAWIRTTFAGVKRGAGDDSLTLIFGISEDITQRKQAEGELLELKRHLQRSIELERLRIAQNLHDVPLQELYAVIYKMEELRPKAVPENAAVLADLINDIKKTLEGLRATASELRPPALSRFGLEKAIRSYAVEFRQQQPEMQLELALAHDGQILSEDIRLVLFRVFQQAMMNIVRHARATQVSVHFSFDAEEARLEVSDNGKGFPIPPNWMNDVREGHYGLAGMAERVSAAGGTLTLESREGGGTIVRAVIPC